MIEEDKIHEMIDLYYDGELSSEEERKLLGMLLKYPSGDAEVEDALAVMTAIRSVPAPKVKKRTPIWKEVAATLAILLISGAFLTILGLAIKGSVFGNADNAGVYVNGVKVSDETVVLNIIQSQLDDMSMASAEVNSELSSDLDDIFKALNEDEI
ncbi:MAG: hypothetical protein K2G13_09110 [Muribaculaceae bacterium]|nr:hypothetical protein [Muribaculaceae bacterium]